VVSAQQSTVLQQYWDTLCASSSDFTTKWLNDYQPQASLSLQLEDMAGLFIVYACGLGVSLLAFVATKVHACVRPLPPPPPPPAAVVPPAVDGAPGERAAYPDPDEEHHKNDYYDSDYDYGQKKTTTQAPNGSVTGGWAPWEWQAFVTASQPPQPPGSGPPDVAVPVGNTPNTGLLPALPQLGLWSSPPPVPEPEPQGPTQVRADPPGSSYPATHIPSPRWLVRAAPAHTHTTAAVGRHAGEAGVWQGGGQGRQDSCRHAHQYEY